MAVSADYVFRETASNLWRNRLMTLAAVLTVAVSLSLVGAALLLNQGVSSAVGKWKGGVDLIVFMQPKASTSQIQAIGTEVKSNPQVKSSHYVNQSASLAEFKRQFANQPDFLNVITAKQLPPSYRIVLRDANEAATVEAQFQNQPGVKKVLYNRQAVDAMLKVTNIVQIVILALAVVLLLSASVLILNAIRMAIFARRREVAVMKLVGATNWFIRIPFMLEGMVQGVVGAIIAAGAVVGLERMVSYAIHHFQAHLLQGVLVSGHQLLLTEIFVVAMGAIVGAGGSALAVRRFLEV
ncbi:MAG: permease-like cell division protein FtsX [Acidimicrobiales bacterium]